MQDHFDNSKSNNAKITETIRPPASSNSYSDNKLLTAGGVVDNEAEKSNKKGSEIALVDLYYPVLSQSSIPEQLKNQYFINICDTNIERLVSKTLSWVNKYKKPLMAKDLSSSTYYKREMNCVFSCHNINVETHNTGSNTIIVMKGEVWRMQTAHNRQKVTEIIIGGEKFVNTKEEWVTAGEFEPYKVSGNQVYTTLGISFVKKPLIIYKEALDCCENKTDQFCLKVNLSKIDAVDTDNKPYFI